MAVDPTPTAAAEDLVEEAPNRPARRRRTRDEEPASAPARGKGKARRIQSPSIRRESGNTVLLDGEEVPDPVLHKRGCPMGEGRVESTQSPKPTSQGGGMATVIRCVDCGEFVTVEDEE